MAVLPTEKYRYSVAEYALAEASVKQNSLFSVPIPMYLGTGIELRTVGCGHPVSCTTVAVVILRVFRPSLTRFSKVLGETVFRLM